MAETNPSHAQSAGKPNAFNPFNFPMPVDFGMFGGFAELWQKSLGDQQARFTAILDEMAKAEEKNATEARRAVEELSRLSLASIDYSRELSSNFRRMTLEMTKRFMETPAASAPAADRTKTV